MTNMGTANSPPSSLGSRAEVLGTSWAPLTLCRPTSLLRRPSRTPGAENAKPNVDFKKRLPLQKYSPICVGLRNPCHPCMVAGRLRLAPAARVHCPRGSLLNKRCAGDGVVSRWISDLASAGECMEDSRPCFHHEHSSVDFLERRAIPVAPTTDQTRDRTRHRRTSITLFGDFASVR